MEGLSNSLHIVGVKSGNGNSTISSHVNGMIIFKSVNLIGGESGISEHTNLAGNVLPVMSRSSGLQATSKSLSH